MKKLLLLLILPIFSLSAQEKKAADKAAILEMCGCYEISFKYSETFSPDKAYEKKEDYSASALEWVLPVLASDNEVVLQHLLIVNDSRVIKHWRQDWVYESPRQFTYDKDNHWIFQQQPAEQTKGKWTQLVYQVDDSPRYSGTGTWIHADGKHYWENKADSPLPRREYTKRSDYNVMLRGNRHEITDFGWIHEQDNDKIIRTDGVAGQLLAQEKGMNIYTRVAAERCKPAVTWWDAHAGFWAKVRASWDKIYLSTGDLTLAKTVDDKPMYKFLSALEEGNASEEEILQTLQKFVLTKENKAAPQSK